MDAHLGVSIACMCEFVENFRVDHCPARLQAMLAEKIGSIEFEGTIHVAEINAKNHPHDDLPTPGIELTHPGILAVNAIPQHRIVFFDQGEEASQILNIKLSIRVHKKSHIFGSRRETAN